MLCGSRCWSAGPAKALPDAGWQKQAAFPDWKGYTDDTLAMNSMLSFRGWHGQGTVWISVSDEVESFALYINGHRLDTAPFSAGIWKVDISDLTVDGVNTLQLSNILPMGLSEYTAAVEYSAHGP